MLTLEDDRTRSIVRPRLPRISRGAALALPVLLAAVIALLSGPSAAAYSGHVAGDFSVSVEGTSPHGDEGWLRLAGPAQPMAAVAGDVLSFAPLIALFLELPGDLALPRVPTPALPPWLGRAPPIIAAS